MGYALFTARKMSLQAKVNNYNYKLMQLENEKTKLTNKIMDKQMRNNAIDSAQNMGSVAATLFGGGIGSGVSGIINKVIDKKQDQVAQVEDAALVAKQQQIDTMKQKYETLLKQAETELQKVEQAEDKAIERSTPKYC